MLVLLVLFLKVLGRGGDRAVTAGGVAAAMGVGTEA